MSKNGKLLTSKQKTELERKILFLNTYYVLS
jgi:hypothetical protein